ncbi:5-methyltetrahydropteroyltriglutamate--homocysteine methyltransferase [Haloarculaceae archaeon H-GB11]|nr:5-methyltetrahydropteroyltriglutamate--homocysteine methyltransferase [Haloarculaceae archaeon H-GB11]
MSDIVATTFGFFPRPPEADQDAADLVRDAQRAAGLDRIVSGQLDWVDHLASPLLAADGVRTGAPSPWSDTDVTYRTPVVTEPISMSDALAPDATALTDVPVQRRQVVLPGPYTLCSLCEDEYYGDDAALLDALASELATAVAGLPPVATVAILEPALGTTPPDDGLDARASDAIDDVSAPTDASVVVHVPGGAVTEKVYAHLMDAAFDALGVDLVADHDGWLFLVNEYGTTDDIALGVVDAHDESVESPSLLADRVAWWHENTPVAEFETVYVTPTDAMAALSWGSVSGKLSALGGVRDAAPR